MFQFSSKKGKHSASGSIADKTIVDIVSGLFGSIASALKGLAGKRLAEDQAEPAASEDAAACEEEPVAVEEYLPERRSSHRRSVRTSLKFILPAAVLIAALVAGVSLYLGSRDKAEVSAEGGVYQVYLGTRSAVAGDAIRVDSKGDVVDQQGAALPALPLYFEEGGGLLLPRAMTYYTGSAGCAGYLEPLTKVFRDEAGNIVYEYEDSSGYLTGGFLADGNGMFIFLDDMSVELNGHSFDVPALSYAFARYADVVTTYNYEKGETTVEAPRSDQCIATQEMRGYVISLIDQTTTNPVGEKRLIYPDPRIVERVGV